MFVNGTPLRSYKFMDSPPILDTAVTPIPASTDSPLQVIADTGSYGAGIGVQYADNTGAFIGVYVGPAGAETLMCIVGNGVTASNGIAAISSQISTVQGTIIPPHSRISLRSMNSYAISQGTFTLSLVGK